ncbi:hypothetical protein IC229_34685 [Spirosoma sp. BT702]|uniref:Uncharacterized protein n=2 Tax=Spirosoma profusum TaxID=2771354 RepID=A0A927AWK8_9BACT|nr:hypothetical protein [Spirosoma profusum]
MPYTTIYDLAAQPVLNWRSLVLPLALAVAASIIACFTRQNAGRYGLFAFVFITVLVSVVMPYWDRYQLLHKEPRLAEGVITNHWEKEWTKQVNGKKQWYSYESFQVNTVTFGYFRNVVMAGFHHEEMAKIPLHDGLAVRIHYVPEQQMDESSVLNRIVKFELAKP